jgi:cytosine/adenosine deaminase-related metal-dependent hydrolase
MRTLLVLLCLSLAACQRSDVKVLIGATAVVAPGAQPIEDSVIVVAEGRIRSAGMRKDVPIPQDSERVNLAVKWIVPAEGARIAVNESADLLILDRSPNGATPALPADVSRRMVHGQWQQ